MKKTRVILGFIAGFLLSLSTLAQTEAPAGKMSVNDRMVKARAAKAEKKLAKNTGRDSSRAAARFSTTSDNTLKKTAQTTSKRPQATLKEEKASPADYQAPVDKSQKGPNGEVVHTGARGGKYYINKNGNKTYLSSNQ